MVLAAYRITRNQGVCSPCSPSCISLFLWNAGCCQVCKEGGDDCGNDKTNQWYSSSSDYNQRSAPDYRSFLFWEKLFNWKLLGRNRSQSIRYSQKRRSWLSREERNYNDQRKCPRGIFYTLTLPAKIGPNLFKDALFVGLNTNLTYLVFIHDPEFFFFNDNPVSTPAIIKRFKTKPNSWSYRLELTEVNKLNLPSSPCADDPSYNFLSCMRKSVALKVQRRNIAKGTTDPRHQVFI